MIATGFGKRCNLIREGQLFVKDEADVSSRVGVLSEALHIFDKLAFKSNEQKFSLIAVKRFQSPHLKLGIGCRPN